MPPRRSVWFISKVGSFLLFVFHVLTNRCQIQRRLLLFSCFAAYYSTPPTFTALASHQIFAQIRRFRLAAKFYNFIHAPEDQPRASGTGLTSSDAPMRPNSENETSLPHWYEFKNFTIFFFWCFNTFSNCDGISKYFRPVIFNFCWRFAEFESHICEMEKKKINILINHEEVSGSGGEGGEAKKFT